jgi:hypothetical protein
METHSPVLIKPAGDEIESDSHIPHLCAYGHVGRVGYGDVEGVKRTIVYERGYVGGTDDRTGLLIGRENLVGGDRNSRV